MANDVAITAGAGTLIATEQDATNADHYQKMKLADGGTNVSPATARVVSAAPAAAAPGLVTRPLLYDANGNPIGSNTASQALYTESPQEATYSVAGRLAARPYALSVTTVANTRKQCLTIHHAATATKNVRLRRVLIALESVTVAGLYVFDLVRITSAPVTGNPALTPAALLPSDPAAESTVLALPTTAATESGQPIGFVEYNQGITGAAPTANPPQPLTWQEVYSEDEQNPIGKQKPPTIRAGVLEGWVITLDPNAAAVVKFFLRLIFTEA